MLLHKFLQFATNRDVMAFDTTKLTASTFGRLRVRTPRVYSWRSSECSNGRLWRGCSQYMIRWWHVISRPTVLLRNELLDVAVWRHLGLMWQDAKHSRRVKRVERVGERGLAREVRGRYWQRVAARGARTREVGTSAGAWRRVWFSFCPFLVGFCSGLAVLSSYAFSLAVEWAERWYPRVAGTVGVMAVARFWQWLLDEGEGSRRTPEMSTGTRELEEWIWYHVNNIKWERKTE